MSENSNTLSAKASASPLQIEFTYCSNFASAESRELPWPDFARELTTFETFPSKQASVARAAFVGGIRADETKGRADGNIIARTVATLDYDAPRVSLDAIDAALEFSLDCAYVAYSTFRHTPEAPRFRLCVPLSRPVNEAEHRAIVDQIVKAVALGEPDKCSYVMAQLMFLPSRQEDVEPWSVCHDGEPWEVPESLSGVETQRGNDDSDNGLEAAVASRPLDLTPAEVDTILDNYPAEGKDYDEWVRVGMALWHQFGGSDEGRQRWYAWSEKSSKHDTRHMMTKWRSFDGDERPVTMASIIHLAGGLSRAVEIAPTGTTFTALMEDASRIASLETYTKFRNRVRELSDRQLPADMRAMIVGRVYDVYGKAAGLGKRELKSAFRKPKTVIADGNGEGGEAGYMDPPEWLQNWVYNRATCTFEDISKRESIKREAFRAAFNRMPECEAKGVNAADYALDIVKIPTVANTMYWPGQDRIFEIEGKAFLNSYFESGVEPCETLEGDDDGQQVVGLFLRHVENTIPDSRERRILIDWLAYVYQNPGKRVNWALLIQGIEGNGKTYFYRVMEWILGQRARTVSSDAIDTPFNGWAEGCILINIEEIRISGTNTYTILDRMKPLLTNDTIAVTHKGVDERHVPNFTSYMMFTNHPDAIPVTDNDRRYCVISIRHTQQQELFDQHGGRDEAAAYFDRLFAESRRRPDALARFFLDWEISADFRPDGRAPETHGLHKMRSLNVSEDRDAIEEAIEEHACAVIGPNIVDVTYLNELVMLKGGEMPRNRALARILTDKGYTQIERKRVAAGSPKKMHFVWFREGTMTSDQAREAVRDFHGCVPEEF